MDRRNFLKKSAVTGLAMVASPLAITNGSADEGGRRIPTPEASILHDYRDFPKPLSHICVFDTSRKNVSAFWLEGYDPLFKFHVTYITSRKIRICWGGNSQSATYSMFLYQNEQWLRIQDKMGVEHFRYARKDRRVMFVEPAHYSFANPVLPSHMPRLKSFSRRRPAFASIAVLTFDEVVCRSKELGYSLLNYPKV